MKIKNIIMLVATITTASIFLYWQNNDIGITNIDLKNSKVPDNFNGYKILQISDLHNKEFGKNQSKLINLTKQINPDIIVVTGDIIDSRRTNIDIAINYMKNVVKIAPVYYIPGNHESRIDEYNKFEDTLYKEGVNILSNISQNIKIDKEEITLIGMRDISFINSENRIEEFSNILSTIKDKVNDNMTILLSHRPDLINIYANNNIDLVFSGHAHGGQIRLPLINGLFAPDQGLIPKYTSGVYKEDNTQMIVSRGLGNSLFPFRIFNKPELILTTLKNDKFN